MTPTPAGDALALALRATADGIVLLDPEGRIAVANAALAAAWGTTEPALVGRSLGELVSGATGEDAVPAALAAVAAAGRWRGELRTRGASASGGIWDATLTAMPGAPGRLAVVGVLRDCSEKHALEQVRADFLSMVTHDIKSPLTVILGYAEMLTEPDGAGADISSDVLGYIRESGEKINALVCNFLDLSRIEAGRLLLDCRPMDLRALVAQAVEHHEWSARRKGVEVSCQGDPVPPIVADESQLERVVTNLIGNAIKYTPGGGAVKVTTARESGHVAFQVRDTGRGIPPDELPHLFEKYRRVREKRRTEGTGLGLFIAKTIVEAHGGAIRVESLPGAGSTFTVLLPAQG